MQTLPRSIKWIGALLGALMLAALALFYTSPGLSLVARLVTSLSGGTVRLVELGGFFPNRLHVAQIEISDSQGVWLRAEQVSLRWSALAMITNHLVVRDVAASDIRVLRRPVPSGKAGGETPRIDIERLDLPRIEIAPPVIGHAAILSASGRLHYTSPHELDANLLVARVETSDSYRITGGVSADVAHGTITIHEGADGILGKLAGLPGLGPVNLTAQADGDTRANRLSLSLSAGPLTAKGQGLIQLATRQADLDVAIASPAMAPSPDIAWQTLSGEVHFHGRFDAPTLQAHLLLANGKFSNVAVRALTLDAQGNRGTARLDGSAEGVVLLADHLDLFARAPVKFQARADLKAAALPVTFSLSHPLATLQGNAQLRGGLKLSGDLAVPSLAPLAALGKVELPGKANLHITATQAGRQMTLALDGKLDTEGNALPARLLGRSAGIALNAALTGADITQSRLQLHGAALTADLQGNLRKSVLNYRLALEMSDLSRLTKTLQGTLSLRGSLNGPSQKAALSVSGSTVLATKGFARQRVNIELQAANLPALRDARLALDGRLDGAPLRLNATLKGEKTRQANLAAHWRSLDAKADLTIAENSAVSGKARFSLQKLADIAAFAGTTIGGTANGTVTLSPHGGKTDALLEANIKELKLEAVSAKTIALHGAVGDLTGKPLMGLAGTIQDVSAQGFHGDMQAKLDGPLDRVVIGLDADLKDSGGTPLKAHVGTALDVSDKHLTLTALDATWHGVPLKLDAPAAVDFANGLAVDRLTAHLGKGKIAATGRLMPGLALTASADGIALEDFRSFLPQGGGQGTISGRAELRGTLTAPQGTVSLQGRQLRASFSSGAVPPAAFDARAELAGDHATVNASITAGNNAHLNLEGGAPLTPAGSLALHASGTADLSLLDPFLMAEGRRLRGILTLDTRIAGTLATPRISGNGKLTAGEFQDYARGVRLHDVTASVEADGGRIRLTQVTAQAGRGSLTGSGSIDLTTTGMPVDINLEAKDAEPISSNLITATVSGEAKLSGHLRTLTTLSGQLRVMRGEINLPQNFPPEVAILNVRRRGQPRLPPPPPQSRIALDLQLSAAGPIFVRGNGMDADMGGGIHIGGTSAAPVMTGEFRMNRGSYSLAGQTLNFTTGRIRFDGVGVRGRLDPTLDFVAQTISSGVTAVLAVGGYASSPKITLSSTPVLPQDEVVAHLLFQQSVKQLTPLQLASIAQAVAAIGGVGGGFNPLGTVRRTLGLDRLSVASANSGATGSQSQTAVEAGRYVARNVYVGVKQNLSGGTQTQVQVDITRRLKAQATLSTGASATAPQSTASQDNGSSIGLSYQFEY
jgi:translocation and assembly module TamB